MQKSFELIAAMRNAATARTLPIERKNYQVCTVEYVLSGAGFLQLNGAPAISIQANEVYFLPKHSDHNYYPDKENPWDKLFFVVNGELMASIFQAYDLARTPVIRNAGMLKHYFTEFIKLRSSGSSSNMAALLFHRFAIDCRLLTNQQKQTELTAVSKLKQILDGDLSEEFTLNKYAAEQNFSSEHLIRLFRSEFATTPQAYRLQRRLNEARQLLLYSELTIKEIAGMVGFSDQYSFSHSFKSHYGKSPRQFRKEQVQ